MDAFWMPFTANLAFKDKPRLFVTAEGMYYKTADGRQVMDGIGGLWCVNAGHGQPRIVKAIQEQAARLDFVSSFSMGHPAAFELAGRIADLTPGDLNHVFFSNSGSEAIDTALKIARAYHRIRGEGGRTRFISRAKGYHGMGWGGLSISGISRHRTDFTPLLGDVAHLRLPYDPAVSAFSRGMPEHGAYFADELSTLLATVHEPASVAAVIVEPVTGSGGVYPPPQGYLKRLREICDKHGILLIFDEVITGFGRLGTAFGAQALGVVPDMMTIAKGMTNGAVPMGGTIVSADIFDTFMNRSEGKIELSHGYTYSAHPLACAAALATLDVYAEQTLFDRVAKLSGAWADAALSLKGVKNVLDVRNIGLLAGIDIAPRPEEPGLRGAEIGQRCFDAGVLVRPAGDTIMLSPPFVISEAEIKRIFATITEAVENTV
ncbi:MAG: aminotransferase class III-fold pyridoxal phosphate-dependent enzyme [Rhodospirillaceae bacterium]|nr:aminotransferase class III-fold pyridoxal phosphate-dependent enzyme [Rhodospirillaceae bacterium]